MWRRICVIIIAVTLCLVPSVAEADTSVEITIYAQGLVYMPNAPGEFTVWYVSDYEVGFSWEKPATANFTMIRAAYGHIPEGRDDGYQVYYGTGNYTTDDSVSVASLENVYYKAWSQDVGGNWSYLFASGSTEGFMSASFLFIGLIGLAGMLTYFSWKRRHILVSTAGALTWLALGFWLLLGDASNLSLTDPWTQILAWVFIIMVFFCFLTLMDVEITNEARGKRWKTWGTKPTEGKTKYQEYRDELYKRTRGGRG